MDLHTEEEKLWVIEIDRNTHSPGTVLYSMSIIDTNTQRPHVHPPGNLIWKNLGFRTLKIKDKIENIKLYCDYFFSYEDLIYTKPVKEIYTSVKPLQIWTKLSIDPYEFLSTHRSIKCVILKCLINHDDLQEIKLTDAFSQIYDLENVESVIIDDNNVEVNFTRENPLINKPDSIIILKIQNTTQPIKFKALYLKEEEER